MKMNMMNIAIGLLVLFLLFSIFGGRTSGYGEACGGPAKTRCGGIKGFCSVDPSTEASGTCQKEKPSWWTMTPGVKRTPSVVQKIFGTPRPRKMTMPPRMTTGAPMGLKI